MKNLQYHGNTTMKRYKGTKAEISTLVHYYPVNLTTLSLYDLGVSLCKFCRPISSSYLASSVELG